MNIEASMTNDELQSAIIDTNTMIKNCEPGAERRRVLTKHLQRLLEIQIARAAMIEIKEAT